MFVGGPRFSPSSKRWGRSVRAFLPDMCGPAGSPVVHTRTFRTAVVTSAGIRGSPRRKETWVRTPVRVATAAVALTAVAAVGIWTVGAVSGPDAAVAGDGVAETGTGDHGAMPSRGVVRSWDLEHMQG